MNFLKDIITASGINVRFAYHVISYVEGDGQSMSITVKVYASKEIFDSNPDVQPLEVKNYYFVPDTSRDSKNIFIQGLEHLKSLPEYANLIET